jgi:hypothetical protein
MITEAEFYKEKIFNKVGINEIRSKYPNQLDQINEWYKSEKYKALQKYKSFMNVKFKQGKPVNEKELYEFYQW